MNSLTNDPDRRGRMSQGARLVAEQHSWVSKAQSYLNLFERVAKEKSSNINESQFAEGTVTTSLVSQ
jgi:hypothetical protein